MSRHTDAFWSAKYSDLEWRLMKIVFITGWLLMVSFIYSSLTGVTDPKGICALIDCTLLPSKGIQSAVYLILFIFAVLYVFEKYMVASLLFLAGLSILVLSAGEANGIASRSELLSAVLIAQLLAYLKHSITKDRLSLQQDRIRYSIQIISAAYVLSALSKLKSSGIFWIFNHKQLAINAKVSVLRFQADFNFEFAERYSNWAYGFFLNHPNVVAAILLITLLIEGVAFVCWFGKKPSIIYGLILFLFHLGIFLMMFVFVPPILLCVFVFVINGPFLMYKVLENLTSIHKLRSFKFI